MKTILTRSPERAAEFIKRGGAVAFPTETVYGLGADVFNEEAIGKIFAAKNRPADNPLIAHIGDLGQIELLAAEVGQTARRLIGAFFPGPLTLVLPKSAGVPLIATAGLDSVGVRMPEHELARTFLKHCETPVVAPSANLSGKPSPTGWEAVFEDLDGRIDCILQGEMTEIGLESTVVDCTGETPLILRTGAVTLEQLREIEPETRLYQISPNEKPKSPGLRHRHYSPRAKVILISDFGFRISDSKSNAFIGIDEPDGEFELIKICASVEEYAHSVFDFFRRCDRENIADIYCQTVDETGIGRALMDRLKRAAE
ncbi:MAG: L-threonylcarbamoyladenylate synthase [Pyrinomonadaceae bacterium]